MIDKAFSIEIGAPIGQVWDEITKTGSVQRAMFDAHMECELRPGGRLRYRNAKGTHTFVYGEVIECTPPTRWVHTFAFSSYDEEPTRVEWDLEELGPRSTRVTVLHVFPSETRTLKEVSTVWPKILGRYKSIVEDGTIPMGTRVQYGMMRAMTFMLPKKMKSENVERAIAERSASS